MISLKAQKISLLITAPFIWALAWGWEPMTQLAPDIIEAILNGRQPYSLSLTDFMKPFPNGWEEQRQHFGF
jgi:hypothetical protein